MIAKEANVDLSNAAGIRRPLPVNFHCISCNRPVDVKYDKNVEPSLPKSERIPLKKSKGPYLTYEIDQVRIRVILVMMMMTTKVMMMMLDNNVC